MMHNNLRQIIKLAERYSNLHSKTSYIKKITSEPIDKHTLARQINKVLFTATKGFYSDDSWQGVKMVWNALDRMGIDWVTTGSEYDRTFPPKYKLWKFEVNFTNKRGKPDVLYGILTASGAGSVEDPLSRYDLTAYVT